MAVAFGAVADNAKSQSDHPVNQVKKQVAGSVRQDDTRQVAPRLCHPNSKTSLQVTKIINAETLLLDDGRKVKLIGLETAIPMELHRARLTRFLEKLTLGKSVQLMSRKRKTDRYGRHMAHIFVEHKDRLTWAQAEIIKHGLGLVAPEPGAYSSSASPSREAQCIAHLLRLEKEARKNKEGFWGDKIFQVRNAWDARELSKYIQTFQIIEGRIKRLSLSRGKIYINFGRKWKSDLTIVVNKATIKAMQLGPDKLARLLEQLERKKIRVRGWIEDRNGPLIRVRNRHQLEIIDDEARKF